jgi:Fur family ferric uptake transcriptional regulator
MPKPHQVSVRSTRQAKAVAAVLPALPGFRSAPEIHAALRGAGERVGLATVYRQLRLLAGQGSVDTIRGASGEMLYRQRRVSEPHYHLACRTCGVSVEVDASEIRRWAERVAAQAGFTSVADTVQLSGLCPVHAGRRFRH